MLRSSGSTRWVTDERTERVRTSTVAPATLARTGALAVPTRTRLAIFPNVPTLAEAGYPELHVASWVGMSAPAGIPEDVAARLSAALDKVVETPEFRERFSGLGMTMFKAMSRDKIESFLEADRAQWAGLIQRFNVQAQ